MKQELFKTASIQVETGCGKMYVHLIEDDTGKVFKVLSNLGKSGTCAQAMLSRINSILSAILQSSLSAGEKKLILAHSVGHKCSYVDKDCCDQLIRTVLDTLTKGGGTSE